PCLLLNSSAYDPPRQLAIKSPAPGALGQSPLQPFPRAEQRNFLRSSGTSQPHPGHGYLGERSSVFQQPLDICHSFTSQGGGREPLPAPYQHQLSEPCPPYPQQSFKQEYHDPLYEQAGQPAVDQGGVNGHRYPGAGVVIKQEQTDFAYDSVAFHSPTTRIKKEPQSPRTDPALSCSRKPPLPYHHGEQCLYS
ncbi:PREDICTED: ETS translocation variant 4, partial [Colobus angolensis palliatus]|uniref:ETS translocation variant 4 n=1 Tax=Colobus angolensis palliatus TaxID=336983 RepID=UPI0005F3BB69